MAVRSLAQQSLVEPFSNNSMLAGYESNYFHHLETVRLSSTASSITFSNLGQYSDFQHLQFRLSVKGTSDDSSITCRLNEDSTGSYIVHSLTSNLDGGYGVIPNLGVSTARVAYMRSSSSQPGFATAIMEILDPFDSTKNTSSRTLGGQASSFSTINLTSFVYAKTDPINSVTFYVGTGNPPGTNSSFQQFSRFSLYGIKARS